MKRTCSFILRWKKETVMTNESPASTRTGATVERCLSLCGRNSSKKRSAILSLGNGVTLSPISLALVSAIFRSRLSSCFYRPRKWATALDPPVGWWQHQSGGFKPRLRQHDRRWPFQVDVHEQLPAVHHLLFGHRKRGRPGVGAPQSALVRRMDAAITRRAVMRS